MNISIGENERIYNPRRRCWLVVILAKSSCLCLFKIKTARVSLGAVAATPLLVSEAADAIIGTKLDAEALENLAALAIALENLTSWDNDVLEAGVREFAEANSLKLGQIAQPLRAALTGSTVSPGIFEVMAALGRDQALARIAAAGTR